MLFRILTIALICFFSDVTPIRAESLEYASNFGELIDLIDAQHVGDLDSALKLLDPEIRNRVTLVYATRSPIGATTNTPRVILVDERAEFTLSFAGHSEMEQGNLLEVLEFDRGSHRLYPRSIQFRPNRAPLVDYEPQGCFRCHGIDFAGEKYHRFIWDSYPEWPGVYGEHFYGNRPDYQFETRALRQFSKGWGKRLRYRQLYPDGRNLEKRELGSESVRISGEFLDRLGEQAFFALHSSLVDEPELLRSILQSHPGVHFLDGPSVFRKVDEGKLQGILQSRNEYARSRAKRRFDVLPESDRAELFSWEWDYAHIPSSSHVEITRVAELMDVLRFPHDLLTTPLERHTFEAEHPKYLYIRFYNLVLDLLSEASNVAVPDFENVRDEDARKYARGAYLALCEAALKSGS